IVARDLQKNKNQGKYGSKYRMVRALDENAPLLSADIFIIEKNARVDHIDNVRRILSSYIQTSYQYPKEDADTLALFATLYNAVYRSDIDYIKKSYQPNVVKLVSATNAGIARNYRDWPGKTRLLIP